MGSEDHHATPIGMGKEELLQYLDSLFIDSGEGLIQDPERRLGAELQAGECYASLLTC